LNNKIDPTQQGRIAPLKHSLKRLGGWPSEGACLLPWNVSGRQIRWTKLARMGGFGNAGIVVASK